MKRRRFLACSAAAASGIAATSAHAASAQSWTLAWSSSRYLIRLSGPSLVVDCWGQDSAAAAEAIATDPQADIPGAAMVLAGPRRQPVSWHATTWHQPDARALRIALSADEGPLLAELTFTIDEVSGLLSRRTTIHHRGIGRDVDIVATSSLCCRIHEPIERVLYLAGEWAHETQVRRGLGDAPLVMQSRAGKTGFEFQPYLALRTAEATYLCELLWSGNWILRIEPGADGTTVSGGLNSWEFRNRIGPTGSLTLPTALFGRLDADLNAATHRLHDYRRAHRPNPERIIPVQFNSWYPYFGELTSDAMLNLVPVAKRLGCEAFVVDAGWYRTDDGDTEGDWEARTGDWRTSRTRFPNGLREVSAASRDYGMRFGLWFEPEVIGPLSAIRREHPDWLHHPNHRPPRPNERAVLNLGIPAARRHAFERVTQILSTVGVDWMKWDFNADLGAGGWAPGLPDILTDQDPLVAHYDGLYRMQDAIRRWFPDLILEMCASGGGRLDGEILSHAHVNWISDQPGAVRKLAIHFGTQLAHPAVVCNDWLIEWPPGSIAGYDDEDASLDERGDLPFRLRVAMLGSFGISARADRWPAADFAVAEAHVALYRSKLRPIIHHGDQYLLTRTPPADGGTDWAAIWYVSKDGRSGVLFAFRLDSAEQSRVLALPGLHRDRRYRATMFSGTATEGDGGTFAAGITITIADRFQSELCLVEIE